MSHVAEPSHLSLSYRYVVFLVSKCSLATLNSPQQPFNRRQITIDKDRMLDCALTKLILMYFCKRCIAPDGKANPQPGLSSTPNMEILVFDVNELHQRILWTMSVLEGLSFANIFSRLCILYFSSRFNLFTSCFIV